MMNAIGKKIRCKHKRDLPKQQQINGSQIIRSKHYTKNTTACNYPRSNKMQILISFETNLLDRDNWVRVGYPITYQGQ